MLITFFYPTSTLQVDCFPKVGDKRSTGRLSFLLISLHSFEYWKQVKSGSPILDGYG